jgi:minor extracellular serine protease Vpr
MLKKSLWICFFIPLLLSSQSADWNKDRSFKSILTSQKASTSFKIWALYQGHAKGIFPDSEYLSIWGSFEGDKSQFENKLSEIAFNSKTRLHTFTATLAKNKVNNLFDLEEITFVDLASKFNSPRPLDEKALDKSQVIQAQNLKNPPLKGRGVVVGIVDVGFQTTHPTFFNETGSSYRVSRFWQQKYSNQMGPAPFYYGILKHTESEILKVFDEDGSHGTHVAGIASGSGFKSPGLKYAGIAPESEMVFVGIKYQNDSVKGSALGDYIIANNAIIDGFDYIFSYADSVKKPAVCNLSWGMHTGPHDGTSLFDLALEDLINEPNPNTGKVSGRALVGANGNSANDEMHVEINLNENLKSTLAMDRSRTSFPNENVYCDFWSGDDSGVTYQIQLIDSFDQVLLSTNFMEFRNDTSWQKMLFVNDDTLTCLVSSVKKYPHNSKGNVLMMLESNKQNRFIKLNFTGKGVIHGWNSGRTYEWTSGTFRNYIRDYKPSHWVNGDASHTLVENGGTSKAILSVGSYNNRVNWNDAEGKFHSDSLVPEGKISNFSSHGAALDGRIKPDVAAPGQYIANAFHKDHVPGWLNSYIVHKDQWNNDAVYWALLSGTSMASPHAAGILALILEATQGSLNAQQMYDIVRSTAYTDAFTGPSINNQYGFGKINANAAILSSMQLNRRNIKSTDLGYFFSYQGKMFYRGDKTINSLRLLDPAGRTILLFDNHKNESWDISNVPEGVYYVDCIIDNSRLSQSLSVFRN